MPIGTPTTFPSLITSDTQKIYDFGPQPLKQNANQEKIGPRRALNGSLYHLRFFDNRAGGASSYIAIWKSSNNGLTWAEIVGPNTDNTSTFGSIAMGVFWDIPNNKVWIAHSASALHIDSFDLGTDSWDATTAIGGPVVDDVPNFSIIDHIGFARVSLVRRADGSIPVAYSAQVLNQFSFFSWRLFLAIWASGSWSSPVNPFNNPSGSYWGGPGFDVLDAPTECLFGMCLGDNDRTHIISNNDWLGLPLSGSISSGTQGVKAGQLMWHVSLDKTNVLDTPVPVDPFFTPGIQLTDDPSNNAATVPIAFGISGAQSGAFIYPRGTPIANGFAVAPLKPVVAMISFASTANPSFDSEVVLAPDYTFTVDGVGVWPQLPYNSVALPVANGTATVRGEATPGNLLNLVKGSSNDLYVIGCASKFAAGAFYQKRNGKGDWTLPILAHAAEAKLTVSNNYPLSVWGEFIDDGFGFIFSYNEGNLNALPHYMPVPMSGALPVLPQAVKNQAFIDLAFSDFAIPEQGNCRVMCVVNGAIYVLVGHCPGGSDWLDMYTSKDGKTFAIADPQEPKYPYAVRQNQGGLFAVSKQYGPYAVSGPGGGPGAIGGNSIQSFLGAQADNWFWGMFFTAKLTVTAGAGAATGTHYTIYANGASVANAIPFGGLFLFPPYGDVWVYPNPQPPGLSFVQRQFGVSGGYFPPITGPPYNLPDPPGIWQHGVPDQTSQFTITVDQASNVGVPAPVLAVSGTNIVVCSVIPASPGQPTPGFPNDVLGFPHFNIFDSLTNTWGASGGLYAPAPGSGDFFGPAMYLSPNPPWWFLAINPVSGKFGVLYFPNLPVLAGAGGGVSSAPNSFFQEFDPITLKWSDVAVLGSFEWGIKLLYDNNGVAHCFLATGQDNNIFTNSIAHIAVATIPSISGGNYTQTEVIVDDCYSGVNFSLGIDPDVAILTNATGGQYFLGLYDRVVSNLASYLNGLTATGGLTVISDSNLGFFTAPVATGGISWQKGDAAFLNTPDDKNIGTSVGNITNAKVVVGAATGSISGMWVSAPQEGAAIYAMGWDGDEWDNDGLNGSLFSHYGLDLSAPIASGGNFIYKKQAGIAQLMNIEWSDKFGWVICYTDSGVAIGPGSEGLDAVWVLTTKAVGGVKPQLEYIKRRNLFSH